MSDEKAWLAVLVLVHPMKPFNGDDGIALGGTHQTDAAVSLWTLLCALRHGYAGREKHVPQIVPTMLEV